MGDLEEQVESGEEHDGKEAEKRDRRCRPEARHIDAVRKRVACEDDSFVPAPRELNRETIIPLHRRAWERLAVDRNLGRLIAEGDEHALPGVVRELCLTHP